MGCAQSTAASGALFRAAQDDNAQAVIASVKAHPSLLSSLNHSTLVTAHAETPLHLASEAGRLDAVKALVNFLAGSRLDTAKEALRFHCRRQGIALPSTLEEAVRMAVNMPNSKGQTPLMHACFMGHHEVVKYLLSRGADIWQGDRCGCRTALHYAAMNGCAACIKALMEGVPEDVLTRNNARYINVRSLTGLVPLHYAVCGGHLEAVRALLHYQPNITAASTCTSYDIWVLTATFSTPLHFAACKGNIAIATELLRYYALRVHTGTVLDPRTRHDSDGRTPWQVAVLRRQPELVDLLHPSHPISALFSEEQLQEQRTGAPKLAAIAAAALRQRLLASVELIERELLEGQRSMAGKKNSGVCGCAAAAECRAGMFGACARVQPVSGAEQEQLQQVKAKAMAAMVVTDPAASVQAALDDEDECLCKVCFSTMEQLRPHNCSHGLCTGCAGELCRSVAAKPLLCPFCRVAVTDFVRLV